MQIAIEDRYSTTKIMQFSWLVFSFLDPNETKKHVISCIKCAIYSELIKYDR